MHDDELMDKLLKDAMTVDAPPELSSAFDANVMRAVRPRRLAPLGRIVMAIYAVLAVAMTIWFIRDVPVTWIAAALVVSGSIAAGASAYGQRLVLTQ